MKTNKLALFFAALITLLTVVTAQAIEPGDVYALDENDTRSLLVIHFVDADKGEITVSARKGDYYVSDVRLKVLTIYQKHGNSVARFTTSRQQAEIETSPYTHFSYALEFVLNGGPETPRQQILASTPNRFLQTTLNSQTDDGVDRTSVLVYPYKLVGNNPDMVTRSANETTPLWSCDGILTAL